MTTIPEVPSSTHEETARAMMVQVRQLAESITGFTYTAPGRRRKLTSTASLPDAFLQSLAVACDASPVLGVSAQLTANELREAIEYKRVYSSLADELELLAKGLRDTIAEHRSDIGQRALRAYEIAKRLARPDDRKALVPHLQNMKRDLGRSRSKVAVVVGPVPATPITPAPTTPTLPIKTA
jgi:hypothetical protein